MGIDPSIVILDGARRTPRADILVNNREPGLFSRFTTTQLGGSAGPTCEASRLESPTNTRASLSSRIARAISSSGCNTPVDVSL